MMRLAISVEGQTEEQFSNRLLIPYFDERGISVTPVLINGRGGDVSIGRVKKDLNKLASGFDKVTTLYDFYGFKGKDHMETKNSLEAKILETISDNLRHKVLPYIQMYEFEGLLFSSPSIINQHLDGENLINWSRRILQEFGDDPERINDSPQTAPSKRLEGHTNYIKTVHGPGICEDIGLEDIRSHCSGFNEWMISLEACN